MSIKYLSSIFKLGVRQKVLLVLLTVLLTALSVSGWMALQQEKINTLQEINQRGSDISRFVAKSLAYSIVGYDYHTLQLLIDEITLSDDIGYAKVVNAKGNVMAESGSLVGASPNKLVMFNQDIRLESEIVGMLTMGLSTEHTLKRLENSKYSLVKREAMIIMMIAFGEFLALSFIIIRPVSVMSKSLNESVNESGQIVGMVPITSQDEFGSLAGQFNKLSAQLNDANLRLQSRVDLADKQLILTNRQLMQQSEDLHRLNEEFRKQSVTDSLTGLNNRRRFEELMQTEMAMSLRHGDINSLLVLDIDHFKKVNDQYGHPTGDQVLKQISAILKSKLRKTDMLCRVGGEEFVALCKRADKNAALEIAEKMRSEVENTPIYYGDQVINITVSIGVATTNEHNANMDPDFLYREADSAVYHSKETGRNRVSHYEDTCFISPTKTATS